MDEVKLAYALEALNSLGEKMKYTKLSLHIVLCYFHLPLPTYAFHQICITLVVEQIKKFSFLWDA